MRREARASVRKTRPLLLVLILSGAAFAPLALADEAPATALCDDPVAMDGVGHVCPRGNGLFEIVGPDGESFGFTHGPDPVPAPASVAARPSFDGPTRAPVCADPLENPFHAIVIYARAVDDDDNYAWRAPQVRHLVERANFLLTESAGVAGTTADYRVLCDESGRVAVREAVLPTPREHADFTTIQADLYAMGYADARTKLWVWYDDTSACSCGGMGTLYTSAKPGVQNPNNGNAPTPLVGVTFGYTDVRIMMHENGHTMGAVSDLAPHSTLSGHCFDGSDIMCYNDGGAEGWRYSTRYCRGMPWDCGNDDYFHPDPPAGAYLENHWNLASPSNRFVTGCHEERVLAVPQTGIVGPLAVEPPVTFTVPEDCRGQRASVWAVDAATQNTVFHPLEVCWRDANGTLLDCTVDPVRNQWPLPLGTLPRGDVRDRVPDVDGVTAEVRFDARGPVVVWLRVA